MTLDWITIALENKGVMTLSKNVHGIAATMNWTGQQPVCGERCHAIEDALQSLNDALQDDAAEQTIC